MFASALRSSNARFCTAHHVRFCSVIRILSGASRALFTSFLFTAFPCSALWSACMLLFFFQRALLHPFFALCKIWISNFWTSKCSENGQSTIPYREPESNKKKEKRFTFFFTGILFFIGDCPGILDVQIWMSKMQSLTSSLTAITLVFWMSKMQSLTSSLTAITLVFWMSKFGCPNFALSKRVEE